MARPRADVRAAGESLYEERIEPERVAQMVRRLRAAMDDDAKWAGTRAWDCGLGAFDEYGVPELDEDGRLRMQAVDVAVLDVAARRSTPGGGGSRPPFEVWVPRLAPEVSARGNVPVRLPGTLPLRVPA